MSLTKLKEKRKVGSGNCKYVPQKLREVAQMGQ